MPYTWVIMGLLLIAEIIVRNRQEEEVWIVWCRKENKDRNTVPRSDTLFLTTPPPKRHFALLPPLFSCRLCVLCEPAPPVGQLCPWCEGYPASIRVVYRPACQRPATGCGHCGRSELQEETLWVLLQVYLLYYTRQFQFLYTWVFPWVWTT